MTCIEFTACFLQVDTKQLRQLVQISCQEEMCSTELIWHTTGLGLSGGDLSCTSQHHAVHSAPTLHRSWMTPWPPTYHDLQSSSAWPGSTNAAQEHLDSTTVLAVMGTHEDAVRSSCRGGRLDAMLLDPHPCSEYHPATTLTEYLKAIRTSPHSKTD